MKTEMDWLELRKLHNQGFALHWLKKNSKVPALPGWTKGPRMEWDTFKRSYREGFNVGVRLGEVSKIGEHYLAVLDLDVKSDSEADAKTAREMLFAAFPAARAAPMVMSGRGNGSAHYYVLVSEPVRGNELIGRSAGKVKVLMPSVAPSQDESDKLSMDELADGYRLRPAYEISLLCAGRQVVLPGSVHPDSGKRYVGKLAGLAFPVIEPNAIPSFARAEKPKDLPSRIEFEDVDIETLGLRDTQLATIRGELQVPDRSGEVFGLCMALMKRGHSDNTIVSLFTDRQHWISQMPYDHAKTESREQAARWLMKYTVSKARAKVTEEMESSVVEVDSELSEAVKDLAEASRSKFEEAGSWRAKLDMKPGPRGSAPEIRATFKNGVLILSNTIGSGFVKVDTFAFREFWAENVPWGCEEGQARRDEDELKLKQWLIEEWHVEYPLGLLTEVLAYFATQNQFHPVKDYLECLEWDGKDRVEKAFETYLGAQMPKAYLRAVSLRFFQALIARVYEPGVKFDHLPVLEGRQGIGKSSFGRILVGERWFMDGLPNLDDKDAALNLTGIWLCEMSELSSLYRSELEVAKAFITRQVDKVRPPYGKKRIELPRQSVFIGTTNDREYLQDSTGNRRFWPVLIGGCDFAALQRDREQLLAEALWLFQFDRCNLWLEGEALRLAESIQESRRVEDDGDAMHSKFQEWLDTPPSDRSIKDLNRVRLEDLFNGFPFGEFQKTNRNRQLAGMVLRHHGYRKVVNGNKGKIWVRD